MNVGLVDAFELLWIALGAALILALAGRLFGRSPASWRGFPFLSATLFCAAFVYSFTARATTHGQPIAAFIALVLLVAPIALLYRFRRDARGVGFVFAILFALDLCERFGLTFGAGFDAGIAVARPLGYSYVLFRMYDALRALNIPRPSSRAAHWHDWLLQTTMFPTFAAGPIVLSGQFRTIVAPFTLRLVFYRRACVLLLLGIAKLYLILPVTRFYFETGLVFPVQLTQAGLANVLHTGLYQYARVFLDFSGYTDLVVGACAFLGLKIRHNFLRPYAAVTLREFWRRWHVTLAHFMRRHVYEPLGGRGDGPARHMRNLLLVFVLLGLWHGLTLPFLIWGAAHGLFMILEVYALTPLFDRLRGDAGTLRVKIITGAQYVLTQSFVTLSWIVFFWK